MTLRVCGQPGCAVLVKAGEGKCLEHRRAHEKARGTRQERGYDADHDRARREWAPLVATGHVKCRRCRLPIDPATAWDLGHPDAVCTRPRAPEHALTKDCPEGGNRATAGRRLTA